MARRIQQDRLPGLEPGERAEERARPRTSRFSASRVAAGSAAAAAALGLGLYGFYGLEQFLIRDPRFTLNGPEGSEDTPTLSVTGTRHASRRAIEAVFSPDLGKSVYLVPLGERRVSLRAVDWVKDATVARVWPNRVMVQVAERAPVAFLLVRGSKPALIDADGVILPSVPDRFRLPVLLGVRPSQPAQERRERVRRMLRLTGELGEAAGQLSEIDVSDADNLKVTQPFEGRVLTLLLGDRNFRQRYDNFLRHYDEIRRRLPDAATLDLRLEDRITVVQ
jgi:cell division protein FtsQ